MKKVGEVLFLGAVMGVCGFAWKLGATGAIIIGNKVHDMINPKEEEKEEKDESGRCVAAGLISEEDFNNLMKCLHRSDDDHCSCQGEDISDDGDDEKNPAPEDTMASDEPAGDMPTGY